MSLPLKDTPNRDGAVQGQIHEPPAASFENAPKANDALNVTFAGGVRSSSPNPSILSIDGADHAGQSSGLLPEDPSRRHTSRSPAPRRSLKGKAQSFWVSNKGLALVLVSQFFGKLMNVFTRILESKGNNGNGFHPIQILFARMTITCLLASLYMWYTKTEHFPFGAKKVRGLLVARGLTGFFGVYGLYYSLLYLPLSDATVITFLAPGLACWACSFLINEPFTRMEQMATYVSLFGVILIARPVSLFASFSHSTTPSPNPTGEPASISVPANSTQAEHLANDYDVVTPSQRAMAVGMAMVGVCGATGAYTTVRWIGKRAHPLISVNYFAAWCTIVSTVSMFVLPGIGFLLPSKLFEWALLFSLGICGFIMQFLLAAGLQYEKSSRATNMLYFQMVYALGFDKLVFGSTPGLLSILGSSLILGSAIYVALHKQGKVSAEGVRGSGRETQGREDEELGLMAEEADVELEPQRGRGRTL